MSSLAKALTGLAALAFVVAVVTHFGGPIFRTEPEAYSNACTNLALLAIAVAVLGGERVNGRRSL